MDLENTNLDPNLKKERLLVFAENEPKAVMQEIKTPPKDLPKLSGVDYSVHTPNRETYFVLTPSYFLRSSVKQNLVTDLVFHNDSASELNQSTVNETPKRCKPKNILASNSKLIQNKRRTVDMIKPSRKVMSCTLNVPTQNAISSKSEKRKSNFPRYARKSNLENIRNDKSEPKSNLRKRTNTALKSLKMAQNVLEACQSVRRSKIFETPQKPHCMLTRADLSMSSKSDLTLTQNRAISSIKRKANYTEKLKPNVQIDGPATKKPKKSTAFKSSISTSERPSNLYQKLAAKDISNRRSCAQPSSSGLQRKSIALTNMDETNNFSDYKPFKAKPVPLSIYNKPKMIKKSINLTVPKSPMLTSKFSLKRAGLAQTTEPEVPPSKLYHKTPKFSVVFKPKLTNNKTKPLPFSFDPRDKERFQRRSERLKELSKPEVFSTKFKAKPVPDTVFNTSALPAKQIKQPTKVKPFQLRSKDRAARSKDVLHTNTKVANKPETTFKANRDYEKILKAKPWKPKIQHKSSTQTQQFTFQSEMRAQKRKRLKENKSSNQKDYAAVDKLTKRK